MTRNYSNFQAAVSISGCVRIGIGFSIVVLVLALGDPNAKQGLIIGRWYNEALLTGVAQMARGILEASGPFGNTVNMYLDIAGTYCNSQIEYTHFQYTGGWEEEDFVERAKKTPWTEPQYPIPLIPLFLA